MSKQSYHMLRRLIMIQGVGHFPKLTLTRIQHQILIEILELCVVHFKFIKNNLFKKRIKSFFIRVSVISTWISPSICSVGSGGWADASDHGIQKISGLPRRRLFWRSTSSLPPSMLRRSYSKSTQWLFIFQI
jgi:hypothetical protein